MKVCVTKLLVIAALGCFLAMAAPSPVLAGYGWHGAPLQTTLATQAVQPASGEILGEESLLSAWYTVLRSLVSALSLY